MSPQESRTRVKLVDGSHLVAKTTLPETRTALERGLRLYQLVELELATGNKGCVNPYCVTVIERV